MKDLLHLYMEGGADKSAAEIKREKVLQGLQIPEEPVRKLVHTAKEYVLEPILTDEQVRAKEGTYLTEKDIKMVIEEDADIYSYNPETKEKRLIAKFRKNVIPHDKVKLGWESFYITAAASRNRGAAAGPIQVDSAYWKKRKPTMIQGWSAKYYQDGKVSKMRVNNNVFSSILGYFEQTPFMGLPCRLTAYTQKYFNYFMAGIPYIEELNKCFKTLNPEEYKRQKKACDEKPFYRIGNTAYSSVTVNRNFRTALHIDDGDFRKGYGNLSVIERGKYHGGYTIFPRYGAAFNLRTGDYLAMDVHEWHCNTEMYETKEDKAFNKTLDKIYHDDPSTGTLGGEKPFTRISFVCYLRDKIRNCSESATRKYYKYIQFDPKKGPLASGKKTRKKKHSEDQE
jgi:hypothetical protein